MYLNFCFHCTVLFSRLMKLMGLKKKPKERISFSFRRLSNLIAFWRTRTRYKQKRACIRTRTARESPPWINCKPYSYNGEGSYFYLSCFRQFKKPRCPEGPMHTNQLIIENSVHLRLNDGQTADWKRYH